jgi:hypothetical protein
MSKEFRFIPLNFHWVALNPNPQGIVYFIGGAFFGSFPTIFYHALLKKVFEAGYTIVAIPFRFTFRHWSVSISIVKNIINLRQSLYNEALFRGYINNINIYLEDSTREKCNYFWLGHSLGCKYISLLEILTDINDEPDLEKVLLKCVKSQQIQEIKNSLGNLDLKDISLKNQPSLFMAPVIAGLENAVPIPPLASLLKTCGLNVQPDVQETECLISRSPLFNLIALIAFERDTRARRTVNWFITNLSQKLSLSAPPYFLSKRNHLAPLGWKNVDELLAANVLQSINDLCKKGVVQEGIKPTYG